MKRVTLLLLVLAASTVYAQKPVKPNLNKVQSLLKDGKLAEAKEMIDAATTYEKTMNDGKTFYLRGLVYASLDTTSNPAYKSLAQDPLKTAIESFKKADTMGKPGVEYFIQDPTSVVPDTKTIQVERLANYYLNEGITKLQADEPDYEGSIAALDKTILVFEGNMKEFNNDTLTYYVLGLSAQNAEKYDLAIEALSNYHKRGGKGKDSYIMLYQMYNGPKENKEKALEVVREGKKKLPNNLDFPRLEIGLLIDLNRVNEAKEGLEKAVVAEPNDKVLRFYLGYANASLKNKDEAVKQYKEALRIDPNYFEAQYYISLVYLQDVDALTKQINNLGISAAENKKKTELFKARVVICEQVIPELEKAERMKAPDKETQIDVLEKLQLVYYYVADDAKEQLVKKKLKMLGAGE